MKERLFRNIFCSTATLGTFLGVYAQTDTCKILDEITVTTGQFQPQTLKNSVYKIKVITSEQIKAKAAVNMAQVLNTELGIGFSNDKMLGVTDVQLMGMSGRSVKILLDGIPVTDRNDTRESLGQIDVQTVERIEIVEGPMSVIYGTDALAGVINIITRKTTTPHLSLGLRLHEETAGAEYSAFGNRGLHLQSLQASFGKKTLFTKGAFTHNHFAGFGGDAYGRNKNWLPKEQYMGNITIGHRGKNNTVHYRLDGLDEKIMSRGEINMGSYTAFDQRYITRRFMHQLQQEWRIHPRAYLNTTVSYTDYSRHTRSTRHDFQTNTDALTAGAGQQDTARFATLFLRTQGLYMYNEKVAIQPGIEINYNAASGARIEGSPSIRDIAFFVSTEWKPTSKINIRPGFRVIKNSVYKAPPIVPALNAKLELSDCMSLRLSCAQGYRAPALRELYFDFVDANHTILGNKKLKAETSNSVNASLSWRSKGSVLQTTATLSSFYNIFNNLIGYATDANNNAVTRLFNVGKFKTTGISYEQFFLWKQWQVNTGALFVGRYNKLKSMGASIPQFNWSPEANAGVSYTFLKAQTQLSFMYKYTGVRKSYQMMNGDINDIKLAEVGTFHWADFTITKTGFKTLMLQAGVKNIFNVSNILNTSPGDGTHAFGAAIPISYGRSYFLSIAYQFKKSITHKNE